MGGRGGDAIQDKILIAHIKKLSFQYLFIIHVIQTGCGECCNPRIYEFASVLVFFVQPHLFGFVIGIVRVHRFL